MNKKETKKEIEAREKKEKADAKALKKLHAEEADKRKAVREKAEHADNNKIHHKRPRKDVELVKVKALCNMHCMDGYELEAGKICEITEDEAMRLSVDKRMEFFEKP